MEKNKAPRHLPSKVAKENKHSRNIMKAWKEGQNRATSSVYQPSWPLMTPKDKNLNGQTPPDKENVFIGNMIQRVQIDKSDIGRAHNGTSKQKNKTDILKNGNGEEIFVSKLSSIKINESPKHEITNCSMSINFQSKKLRSVRDFLDI